MIPGSQEEHASFVKSFGFAVQGFRLTVRSERNIKVMLGVAVLAIVLGFACGIDANGWGVILVGCGMVLCAELFNTAIETVVDLVSPEYHPLAGRAKDVAAAAVWVLSVFVALAGIVVYLGALLG
ncbi:MAG: diacylglycerol kinase family protein [Atopobiaceae bacterium]|nr:diacylglycerol kinase family protein [Atopobiaceae bacterium]